MAHEDSIPIEARLEQLILGDESDLFWVPKPKNNFEMDATLELAKALRGYERAFGLENTIQQLDLLRATARTLSRKNAAQTRMIEARREINAEAAAARAAGNEALARSIEERPTPDYPERESDELELGYYVK